MSLTGLPDGEPGGGPMKVGVAVADLFTGMYTASAILAALYRREQTGEGATIDMALFDTQLAMLANQASNALVSGVDPGRLGAGHPNIVPYQPFNAADQPIIIAVGNDRQFARLAAIVGHPEWAEDPAYATNAARVARARDAGADDRRDHRDQAGRGVAGAAGSGGHSRPGRSTRSARRWPIRRRFTAARINAGGGALGEVPMVGSPIRHRRRAQRCAAAAAGARRAWRFAARMGRRGRAGAAEAGRNRRLS